MSFISNVNHLTLGEGVYNNVQGNIVHNTVHNTFYGRKRRIEDGPDVLPSLEPARKRRRDDEEDGIEVILNRHLKLTLQIGNGPEYLLHAGETEGRAVIVKVFNAGPTVRERLESTVCLSKRLLHPNVLQIEGVSSPASSIQFIAYQNDGVSQRGLEAHD
ncbi:hypothetical protein DFH07DRAFT_147752 [Mycena maculata]|uniref:Protein kinase domain-containing protein n=1 Tax=Mycena maculata TaxID=230809 RepID=A0AAD7JVX5_9AGAR|nr:hypothetical protein DFH07DRAFT_147752 [Mycena maculata]